MKLIIEDDEGRKTVVPFVRDEISIGRNEGNTIRLTERNVSRRHARFVRGSGHVFIEDLGSYNGVRINGDSVQGRAEVQEGDLIEIGDYNLAVQAEAGEMMTPAPGRGEITSPATPLPISAAPSPITPPPAPAPDLDREQTVPGGKASGNGTDQPAAPASLSDLEPSAPRHESTAIIRVDFDALGKKAQERKLESGEQPSLAILSTEFAGQTYVLDRSLVTIGRTDDNDIQLDHRSMSRQHCRIFLDEEGSWKVADLGSANGVRVNGETYGLIEIHPGDMIELGHLKMRFCGAGEAYTFVPEDEGVDALPGQATRKPAAQGGRNAGGVPLPWVLGGAAAILLLFGGGLWVAFGSDPTPTDVDPTAIRAPRAGTPIVPPTAVAGDPANPGVSPAAGTADPAKAAAALREAIQAAGEAVERQEWGAARAAYEKALALDGTNAAAQAGLTQASLELTAHQAFEAGKDLLASKAWLEGIARLEEVPAGSLLENDARNQILYARKKAASDLKKQAEAAMSVHDYPGALEVAQTWLALEPGSKAAHRTMDRARKAARVAEAANRRPPRPRPRPDPPPPKRDNRAQEANDALGKGIAFYKKSKFELAAKQFERALKLDPAGQGLTHKMLGMAYARLKKNDLAAKHYRLFVQKNPSSPEAARVRSILSKYEARKQGG